MILFIGMAGAFLLYKAGNSINPKNQGGLLIAGFATIGIAMLLGFRLVDIKVWIKVWIIDHERFSNDLS